MEKKIRIMIADDKALMRTSLVAFLNDYPQFEVVDEVANGRELLDAMKKVLPDVVLLDIEMPVMGGLEALKIIQPRFPEVKVIVLSVHRDVSNIRSAIALGAKGYLTKDCLPDQLVKAITTVNEAGFYMEEAVSNDLMQETLYGTEHIAKEKLSKREKEVLIALCDGKSEKEIAQHLNISHHTVHFHKMNIYSKIKSHNLAGLVKYAHDNYILAQPGLKPDKQTPLK